MRMDVQPDLEVQVAVAKVSKYAVSESGDTVEVIERPHGGLSLVLVDGQRSGHSAKAISNIVARKAVSLLADGVRDGAAARAAHDYLRTLRGGKVSATLTIVSVDLGTRTMVISRNSHCPMIIATREEGIRLLDEAVEPIGVRRGTKPCITELPLRVGTRAIVYTDGLERAGSWSTPLFDVPKTVAALLEEREMPAQDLADTLLDRALDLEEGRPRDDISVLVLYIADRKSENDVRRLRLRVPL